jgi:hypothetical protein
VIQRNRLCADHRCKATGLISFALVAGLPVALNQGIVSGSGTLDYFAVEWSNS